MTTICFESEQTTTPQDRRSDKIPCTNLHGDSLKNHLVHHIKGILLSTHSNYNYRLGPCSHSSSCALLIDASTAATPTIWFFKITAPALVWNAAALYWLALRTTAAALVWRVKQGMQKPDCIQTSAAARVSTRLYLSIFRDYEKTAKRRVILKHLVITISNAHNRHSELADEVVVGCFVVIFDAEPQKREFGRSELKRKLLIPHRIQA